MLRCTRAIAQRQLIWRKPGESVADFVKRSKAEEVNGWMSSGKGGTVPDLPVLSDKLKEGFAKLKEEKAKLEISDLKSLFSDLGIKTGKMLLSIKEDSADSLWEKLLEGVDNGDFLAVQRSFKEGSNSCMLTVLTTDYDDLDNLRSTCSKIRSHGYYGLITYKPYGASLLGLHRSDLPSGSTLYHFVKGSDEPSPTWGIRNRSAGEGTPLTTWSSAMPRKAGGWHKLGVIREIIAS